MTPSPAQTANAIRNVQRALTELAGVTQELDSSLASYAAAHIFAAAAEIALAAVILEFAQDQQNNAGA